jgi:hypothetical protein
MNLERVATCKCSWWTSARTAVDECTDDLGTHASVLRALGLVFQLLDFGFKVYSDILGSVLG